MLIIVVVVFGAGGGAGDGVFAVAVVHVGRNGLGCVTGDGAGGNGGDGDVHDGGWRAEAEDFVAVAIGVGLVGRLGDTVGVAGLHGGNWGAGLADDGAFFGGHEVLVCGCSRDGEFEGEVCKFGTGGLGGAWWGEEWRPFVRWRGVFILGRVKLW